MSDTIQSISLLVGSGITPLRSNSKYWSQKDYPWLKTEQIGEYEVYDTSEYISEYAVRETGIKLWPPHTISVAMYGEGVTRGKVSMLMKEMATNQACCNIVIDPTKAYYRYVYYVLKNSYERLRSLANGVRKNLNADIMKDFPIALPKIEYQRFVADYLSALDRKIILNNQIITELEKTVKLLYDYWFVQFDFPNADGKPYRASGGEMVWNKQLKREVPKGWTHGALSDIAHITMGQSPDGRSYNTEGDGIIFFQGCTDFGHCFPVTRVYTTQPSRIAEKGDILLSVRAPVGTANIASEKCCIGRGLSALRSKTGANAYLYQVIKGLGGHFNAINRSGTTFGALTKEGLYQLPVCKPERTIIKAYEEKAGQMSQLIYKYEMQIRELTALRNFLLPLLMNGQVRAEVATAATTVEERPSVAKEPSKREAVFKRLVLAAYILDNICDESTAGRVKFEKLLYLSEHCAQLSLYSEFHRAAAGPYDSKSLYSIENQLSQNKWFKRQKVTGESRAYIRLAKINGYRQYVGTNFDAEQKGVIDKLISLFKTARTIQCEIVATLYGAWNDFLLEGIQPSDAQIVDEVLTNWHERKERISHTRWLDALKWMRSNEIVPVGYGGSTKGFK